VRFVDADVFIYVLMKSPKKDYEISRGILMRIEDGEEAATSLAVLQEVVDWLEYNNRKKEVRSFLTAVNSYLTMSKLLVKWESFFVALDDVEKYGADFVDALTLQTMLKNGIDEIYSNDKDFDRVPGIKRVWE
jgi:predicted nucleic acid-binding protein